MVKYLFGMVLGCGRMSENGPRKVDTQYMGPHPSSKKAFSDNLSLWHNRGCQGSPHLDLPRLGMVSREILNPLSHHVANRVFQGFNVKSTGEPTAVSQSRCGQTRVWDE